MKKQVVYIHGGEAFNTYDRFIQFLQNRELRDLPGTETLVKWTRTLAGDLGDEYEVFMPSMPNRENAKYEEWKIWFERHFEYFRDDIVLIGCSLGAMFLTRYCTENETPFTIRSLILMAGAVADLESEDCGDFLCDLDRVSVLTDRAGEVVIMHSKDDFVVPFSHGEQLHTAIPGSEFVVFEDKNHFLVEELPELVERVRR